MGWLGVRKTPRHSATVTAERRAHTDRRRSPTPIFSRYTLIGRRRGVRREEDSRNHVYVDRYSPRLFMLILAIVILGIADAFFTIYYVLVHHAIEVNPLMNFFLGKSPHIFFYVKYILTAVCLIVLCLHKNLPVVRFLLMVILFIYLVVVVNHMYLLFMVS